MELGIFTFGDIHKDPVHGTTVSPAQNTLDILERARLADEVGLHYFGAGEHHRPDYSVASPATVLAAAAAQTKRIKVGSAVTVLSTEDPVRVFQQFATIDLISQGRAELTAGRGSFIESYALFGARLDDYEALYEEKLDLLLKFNAGERVTWNGRFRPALDDAEIRPRPFPVRTGVRSWISGSPPAALRRQPCGPQPWDGMSCMPSWADPCGTSSATPRSTGRPPPSTASGTRARQADLPTRLLVRSAEAGVGID